LREIVSLIAAIAASIKTFFTKESFTKETKETTWKESNSSFEGEYPAS